MKQFKHKKLLALGGMALGVLLLSSCTANFCSPVDKAAMAYPYDQGVTVYVDEAKWIQLNADEGTKDLIQRQLDLSAEAAALGLPTMAGPAFTSATGEVLNDKVYKYVPYEGAGDDLKFSANKASFLNGILSNAKTAGYTLPGVYYYAIVDDFTLKAATVLTLDPTTNYVSYTDFETKLANETFKNSLRDKVIAGNSYAEGQDIYAVNPYLSFDPTASETEIPAEHSILRGNGKVKFSGYDPATGARDFFHNINAWNTEIRKMSDLGFAYLTSYDVPGVDFTSYYRTQVLNKVDSIRSCIATTAGYYGHYGTYADWRVAIEQKDWGYAWGRGFLEGLLVYPVTWLLDCMAFGMDPALSGTGQIFALIFVTLIVRGLLLALSWRSTFDSQKMQALQPELTKLQQKYPNSNTNTAEKQRLSQEQMMLYRRNGIKPFRQILVMIVQFPVFICVWAGLQGSAALSTGEVLNMRLSDNINTILFNTTGTWYQNTTGWWTALILFILMAATQIMAMLLPRIIAKRANKKVAKTSANPAADQQGKTMKIVSYGLIAFTIIMGFFLPSAMGVYWLIGGCISMIQTAITQAIMAKHKKNGKIEPAFAKTKKRKE